MNTSAPDKLRQGISLQNFQELIPEARTFYPTYTEKMVAYNGAFMRLMLQLTSIVPTWTTLTQNSVRLQAMMAINHMMMATEMRRNQEETHRRSRLAINTKQIEVQRPGQPAKATQQFAAVIPLTRTESRPLNIALEMLEEERMEQAKTPEPQRPKSPDTMSEEEEEDKAKDKKEDQEPASPPNQETQGRNNEVEIVEHALPEQIERRVTRSQTRKKPKTE